MTLKRGAALITAALLATLAGCASVDLKKEDVVGRWVSTDVHEYVLDFAEDGAFSADDIPRLLLRSNTPLVEADWEDRLDLTGSWTIRNGSSVRIATVQLGSNLYVERDNGELRLCSFHDLEAPWDGYCFVKLEDASPPRD